MTDGTRNNDTEHYLKNESGQKDKHVLNCNMYPKILNLTCNLQVVKNIRLKDLHSVRNKGIL